MRSRSRMEEPAAQPFDDGLDEIRELEKAKSKLIMDFGLDKQQTTARVNIEVLQRLIKQRPDRMTVVARKWLRSKPGR